MKICQNCKHENNNESKFCIQCGADLAEVNIPDSKQQEPKPEPEPAVQKVKRSYLEKKKSKFIRKIKAQSSFFSNIKILYSIILFLIIIIICLGFFKSDSSKENSSVSFNHTTSTETAGTEDILEKFNIKRFLININNSSVFGVNKIIYTTMNGGAYYVPELPEGNNVFDLLSIGDILTVEGELVIINDKPYFKFFGVQIPDEQFSGALIPVGDYDEKNKIWTVTYKHIDLVTERLGLMQNVRDSYMRKKEKK